MDAVFGRDRRRGICPPPVGAHYLAGSLRGPAGSQVGGAAAGVAPGGRGGGAGHPAGGRRRGGRAGQRGGGPATLPSAAGRRRSLLPPGRPAGPWRCTTSLPWGISSGGATGLHPLSLYVVLGALGGFALGRWFSGGAGFPGQVFLALVLYGAVVRLVLEWVTLGSPWVGPLTRPQVFSLTVGVGAWAVYLWRERRHRKATA